MKKPAPIEPILRSNILALSTAYMRHTGLKSKTVSTYCHGDPPFLEKLSAGLCSVTGRKYDVVIGWFFDNWPDDLAMPAIRPILVASKPKNRAA